MRVEGRLEHVRFHRAEGWVWEPDQPGNRVTVALYVDETLVSTTVADLHRDDLARKPIGDGRHGFSIPLPGTVAERSRLKNVAVKVVGGPELRGRIEGLAADANGRIESRDHFELRGWAHGPNYSPAELNVFADGRLIITWPCRLQRNDPAFNGISDGRFGFRLPLDRLIEGPGRQLEVRIAGTPIALDLPAQTQASASIMAYAELPRQRYGTATQAREALIRNLHDARLASHADQVLLSWDTLQHLLNTISKRENAIEERRSTSRLRSWVGPVQRPDSDDAVIHSTLQKLLSLSREAANWTAKQLADRIAAELLPIYREGLAKRRHWLAAIERVPDRKLLRALAKVFRQADFLELPAAAYHAGTAGQRDLPLASVRYARALSSWANLARARDIAMPASVVEPRARARRTAYVLWRSVPYDTNGYAIRSHYLLRSLRSLDQDVFGVTRLGYPWDAERKLSAGSYIEHVDGLTYVRLGGAESSRNTMTLENYVIECSHRIAHLTAAIGADVVHSASNWLAGLPALRAARLMGLPFCYEVRGLWEITRASSTPGYRGTDHFALFERMEGVVARGADIVFAITKQVKAELIRRGVDESRIVLAPNGVETERFVPREIDLDLKLKLGLRDGDVVFGFIGTFARYEGLIDLCRASTELARRGKRFKILLIGDGGVFEEVSAYKREFDGSDHLILTGRVPFETVPSYYSLIDVAIFPRTSNEITEMVSPLKPFEAMAMGKPVIGSNVAPIAEIVDDGETGWLFEKGSVDDLVRVMGAVIDDPSKVAEAGPKARRFIEANHDWRIIAGNIAKGWEQLRSNTGSSTLCA